MAAMATTCRTGPARLSITISTLVKCANAFSLLSHLYLYEFSYALGESAMMNLRAASVLISGVGSVGVEIAKNLILGGVRHITIQDTRTTTWHDLSAQVRILFIIMVVSKSIAVLSQ